MWLTPEDVLLVLRRVCVVTVWSVGAVVVTAPTMSTTGSPTIEFATTEAVVPVPRLLTNVPTGVAWLTPVKETDEAVTSLATGAVTTTLWLPAVGATRYQISVRTVPFVEAPAKVSAAPL